MADCITMEKAIARLERLRAGSLLAVDGLPCSGKSTLVERLRERIRIESLQLDEFVLPEKDWPGRMKPAFPFEYIRYDEFLKSVEALASTGECSFRPFDWNSLSISDKMRTVTVKKPVVVEGVSALNPALHSCYTIGIFV